MNSSVDNTLASALLAAAASGLTYISESEAPVEPIVDPVPKETFGELEAQKLLGRLKQPVQLVALDDFFSDLTAVEDWQGPSEKQRAERYRDLQRIFSEKLTDPRGFRIGEVRVGILLVGRTSDGYWVGIKTEAVET